MKRRKTAGERIAFKHFPVTSSVINTQEDIAEDIDCAIRRAIRRAQAKAWDEGYFYGGGLFQDPPIENPYRGRERR